MSQPADQQQEKRRSHMDNYMVWGIILGPMIGLVIFDDVAHGLGLGLALGLLIGAIMDQRAKEDAS